jgi:hypothetical protein
LSDFVLIFLNPWFGTTKATISYALFPK